MRLSDTNQAETRLADSTQQALLASDRRIVIVGARGWIGRTALDLLSTALGSELATRVRCFGSGEASIKLPDGAYVRQQPLDALESLEKAPTLLLHLAFLTKDKIAGMDSEAYVRANETLSGKVFDALDRIGVDRLFLASSGAAAFSDDPDASADLRLYGRLKRQDEERFAGWAELQPETRRIAIGRIFSLSGPHINKHDTYALASFILDALAGRPVAVRAPMPVFRSYVAVRELVSFVLAALLAPDGPAVLRFDTGGAAMELGEVARHVTEALGGAVTRAAITDPEENRYVGDDDEWNALLARYRISPVAFRQQITETAAYLARSGE